MSEVFFHFFLTPVLKNFPLVSCSEHPKFRVSNPGEVQCRCQIHNRFFDQQAPGRLTTIPKKTAAASLAGRPAISRRTTITTSDQPREVARGASLDRTNKPTSTNPSPELKKFVSPVHFVRSDDYDDDDDVAADDDDDDDDGGCGGVDDDHWFKRWIFFQQQTHPPLCSLCRDTTFQTAEQAFECKGRELGRRFRQCGGGERSRSDRQKATARLASIKF